MILIAGGVTKDADFSQLVTVIAQAVKAVVLIGLDASELQVLLKGILPVYYEPDMTAAVLKATQSAAAGDYVLLSPACASQDQFRDYQDRGECFRNSVEKISSQMHTE